MTACRQRKIWRQLACALALGGLLTACSHSPSLTIDDHYQLFKVGAPKGSTVNVCHAYGCRMQSRIRFGPSELGELEKLMASTRKADTPAEERRAIAYAIGWIERHVGAIIGTSADRPGMDFSGSGDPTQQDCVDEATNTTSYLKVLQNNGLLKHHIVGVPFAKENYLRGIEGWTHWTAVIKETKSGQQFAVDSWIYKNGENPAVVETEKWYIAGLDNLPSPTR
jgi:hypothetical protein